MTPTSPLGAGFETVRGRQRASAVWLRPFGALGFGLVQLGCSKSEPLPATPQMEAHAAVTATAQSLPTAAPAAAASDESTGVPQNPTAAGATPTSHGRWPSALGESSAGTTAPAITEPAATTPPSPAASPPWPGLTGLGSSRDSSQVTGCLAQAPSNQTPTRSAGGKSSAATVWRATPLGNGVLVTHTLEHACCLQGSAKATVSGATITIEEQLSGEPCRCVCESTIQTRVPAPPGDYDVQTVTVTNGQRHVVRTQRVTVGIARPAKGQRP